MAVIIQVICGSAHSTRFYPVFSGTAQSYNFYPIEPQRPEDGIVSMALGLGKMVVEGGRTIRFSPKHPKHIIQLANPKMALDNNQHEFFALELCHGAHVEEQDGDYFVKAYPLMEAERDGVLHYVGSTYSKDNDAIYDGISRPGIRLVTFSSILKYESFPLAEIMELLLDLGSWAMGTPVDIEFAVDLNVPSHEPKKFSILQIRPMVLTRDVEKVKINDEEKGRLLCQSTHVLGNGIIRDIRDIVLVDPEIFERNQSQKVAEEISRLNAKLIADQRPYLLIGAGRWGSMDPYLGIPVRWGQISGARVIIEAEFRDMKVDPSQGSHFLENLNSFSVGYFTILSKETETVMDWEWLRHLDIQEQFIYTKHIELLSPLDIRMSGRQKKGIILKPDDS